MALLSVRRALGATAVFNSLVSDFVARSRVTGLHLDYHVLEQNPLLPLGLPVIRSGMIAAIGRALCLESRFFAPSALELLAAAGDAGSHSHTSAITVSERVRVRAILDAAVAAAFGLNHSDLSHILRSCDLPSADIAGGSPDPKGF